VDTRRPVATRGNATDGERHAQKGSAFAGVQYFLPRGSGAPRANATSRERSWEGGGYRAIQLRILEYLQGCAIVKKSLSGEPSRRKGTLGRQEGEVKRWPSTPGGSMKVRPGEPRQRGKAQEEVERGRVNLP